MGLGSEMGSWSWNAGNVQRRGFDWAFWALLIGSFAADLGDRVWRRCFPPLLVLDIYRVPPYLFYFILYFFKSQCLEWFIICLYYPEDFSLLT
jgi:hypothetical protein